MPVVRRQRPDEAQLKRFRAEDRRLRKKAHELAKVYRSLADGLELEPERLDVAMGQEASAEYGLADRKRLWRMIILPQDNVQQVATLTNRLKWLEELKAGGTVEIHQGSASLPPTAKRAAPPRSGKPQRRTGR